MKELLTATSNMLGSWSDKNEFMTQVEVILIVSEPTYAVDATGEVNRHRSPETIRFVSAPKNLRKLAELLVGIAKEADELPIPFKQ